MTDRPVLPVSGSLSPSRAADFKTCPLLFRLRSIDRLPQAPSLAAARGTLVHAVLETLFDLPAAERTLPAATDLLTPAYARLLEHEPGVDALFGDRPEFDAWLASAADLLGNYFRLEDPSAVEPAWRERFVEVGVGDVRLRGVLDRLDVGPGGEVRVVDYKTGGAPGESCEGTALFQLKFYALLFWRTRGVVPQLRLVYLRDAVTLTYTPDAGELDRFERTVLALWAAIRRALPTGDFPPSPSRVCEWCDFRELCPAWGGTPPPYPAPEVTTAPPGPQP